MTTTTRDAIPSRALLSPEERQLVAMQLERMVASPLFSQSKRYAPFLRHVVEKALDGQEDTLKERILGIELFGRAPNYDSSNDPVVRVTAGEVRKRIAQYYDDPSHRHEFRIDLPLGSYVAQFHPTPVTDGEQTKVSPLPGAPTEQAPFPEPVSKPPAEGTSPSGRSLRGRIAAAAVALTVLACAGLQWSFGPRARTPLNVIWSGLASSRSPLIIALGEPPPLYPIQSTTDEPTARQHLRNDHVSFSEVQALLRVAEVLDHRDAAYRVQTAGNTSFADLRQGPVVLLGGLDNAWTLRAQQSLRYGLQTDGNGVDWISDSHDPGARKWSIDFNRPYSQVTTDYAIIAFFRDPSTQQPTLIIAGMGENGTKAASEFITDAAELHKALGDSLPRPAGGDFEVVITTEVINGSSGAPRVLAKEIW